MAITASFTTAVLHALGRKIQSAANRMSGDINAVFPESSRCVVTPWFSKFGGLRSYLFVACTAQRTRVHLAYRAVNIGRGFCGPYLNADAQSAFPTVWRVSCKPKSSRENLFLAPSSVQFADFSPWGLNEISVK